MDEPILIRPSELCRILDERIQAAVLRLLQEFDDRNESRYAALMQAVIQHSAKPQPDLPELPRSFGPLKDLRTSFDNYRDPISAVNTDASTSDTLSKAADILGLEQAMVAATVGSPAAHEKRRAYRDTQGFVSSMEVGFQGDGPIRVQTLRAGEFSRIFTPRDNQFVVRKDRRPMFAHPAYFRPSNSGSSSPHIPPSTPPSSLVRNPTSSPHPSPASSPPSSPPYISQDEDCNAQLDVGDDDNPSTPSPYSSPPAVIPHGEEDNTQLDTGDDETPLTPSPFATIREPPSKSDPTSFQKSSQVDVSPSPSAPASAPAPPVTDAPSAPHKTFDLAQAVKYDPSSSQNDILNTAKDVPLPGHDVHSGPGMNADHPAGPPPSKPDDVVMTNETASPEKSEVDADVAPMDESLYTTIGPDTMGNGIIDTSRTEDKPEPMDEADDALRPCPTQTGNGASLTTTADFDPMDTTLSSETSGDTSTSTKTTYAGKKRKYPGSSDQSTTTQPLVIDTAIFNMAGSAFDAELTRTLEDAALKIDEYTFQNPLCSTYSFKGQKIQDWVPHVVKLIRHQFFSELKDGEYIPKWHDGLSPDFQETYRKVVEFTMSSFSVWTLGPCLLNAMMPVMILEKKLAIEPSTIDATQISKKMLHSGSLPSQETRRDALWRIFEALVHAHLRMTLYLAQRPDSRRVLGEFVAAKWDFLERKALDLEHQCAMDSITKRLNYDVDNIVKSFGDSSNTFVRKHFQFIAEHHFRPYSSKPPSYMSSVDAYKDYHKDMGKYVADDGVMEMMLMIRVNAPHVQNIRYSRDTDSVSCAARRLANVREIYARLTLADDLWMISMDSTIFAPCAVDDVYDTKGPKLARLKLAKKLEMSVIEELEGRAAKLKPEGKRIPSSYTALYESRIRHIMAPLIDRPTETLKLRAVDRFGHVENSVTMDPRKFQHDSPRSNPFEVEDWKRGWGLKEEHVESIDQPRVKHRRKNRWQKTQDDGIQREWSYMARRLGMSKFDERPWAIPGKELNYESHRPSLSEFLDALRAPDMQAG